MDTGKKKMALGLGVLALAGGLLLVSQAQAASMRSAEAVPAKSTGARMNDGEASSVYYFVFPQRIVDQRRSLNDATPEFPASAREQLFDAR
jgi:hypothetical protein